MTEVDVDKDVLVNWKAGMVVSIELQAKIRHQEAGDSDGQQNPLEDIIVVIQLEEYVL